MSAAGPGAADAIVVSLEAALRRASALHQAGKLAEAEALYREILAAHPGHVECLQRLGMLQHQQGRKEEALASISAALVQSPGSPEVHSNLGLVLQTLGRVEEALASYERALALRPDHVKALCNRGMALQTLGRSEEALASFERALSIRPDLPEALHHRGLSLHLLGRLEEALASYEQALARRPDYPEALGNRASALMALDRLEEAAASYDRVLALQPDRIELLNGRGTLLHRLNRHREALESYAKVLALNPDCDEARWNASLALLSLGDLARGFEAFEARWKLSAFGASKRVPRKPPWLGAEPVAGRTLLLHAEQGLGDAIQFVRYAPLLARRGARVLLRVRPELKTLFEGVEGVKRVVLQDDRLPRYDLHCPLMSLPLACGTTTLESIPAQVPYLAAQPDRVARWRRRLGKATRPRVGLAWSGHRGHPSDGQRSIRFERLLPLLRRPDIEFVSVQKDLRDEDRAVLEASGVRQLGADLEDFADAAALISLLDLLVSADTAVVHVAGALARPVWVLLPFCADWRWMLEREDSPWYPTARLFRQRRIGDWGEPIGRVGAALDERFGSGTRTGSGS